MILPYQKLIDAVFGKQPFVSANHPILKNQIQPATFDCRLADRVYRMSTSMVPQPDEKVADLIRRYCIYDFEIREGSVLEPNACYFIPMEEQFNLPEEFFAVFSPKSSTGRVDTFVRVLSNGSSHYDVVPRGYKGELYLEIIPLSFLIGIAPSLELTQFRLKSKDSFLTEEELRLAHAKYGVVYLSQGELLMGDPGFFSSYVEQIQKVTLEEIQHAALAFCDQR